MTTGFCILFFYLESKYRHREKWKYCSLCDALWVLNSSLGIVTLLSQAATIEPHYIKRVLLFSSQQLYGPPI